MKRNLLTLAAITFGLCFLCTAVVGQLVQVGPGYVKAPFVRVYSDPGGGTYVRAPFVKVYSHGSPMGRVVQQSGCPTPEELAQLDWRTLRLAIRELSKYLDWQLSSLATGDQWQVYLQTAEIRALVRVENAPASDEILGQLLPILASYDATGQNPDYRSIAALDGFHSLHHALLELAAPPDLRLRRQLFTASNDLYQALTSMGAEAAWHEHLALPEGLALPSNAVSQGEPVSSDDLAKVLARYDAVARNSQYRLIARIPAFRAVHERLGEYLALTRTELSGPRSAAEELPAPRPAR